MKTGLIDVHHHILPPQAAEQTAQLMANWSPEKAVAEMDDAGIATGIAFPGLPPMGSGNQKQSLVRNWNEYGARLGQDHPGRFGIFASLPFPDIEVTLAEIDYALDSLNADGFGVATSYGDLWLGDEQFWPIYDHLNSRAAVVFVHPTDAPCCMPQTLTYHRGKMHSSWIEWPMNTARTIMSLIVSGTLRKFPRIRFIFSHGGGLMPLLVDRIAGLANWPAVGDAGLKELMPDGIHTEFKQLYFECAQTCSATNMAALRSQVADTQILFGSDYPIFSLAYGADMFVNLALSQQTRRAIGRENAASLLPRWV